MARRDDQCDGDDGDDEKERLTHMSNHQKLPLPLQQKLAPISIRPRKRSSRADPANKLNQMSVIFVLARAVEDLTPSGRMKGFIPCYLFRTGQRSPRLNVDQ